MKWISALTALLVLSGCGGNPDKVLPVDVAAARGVLIRGNGAEPESLDPHLATSVSAGRTCSSRNASTSFRCA